MRKICLRCKQTKSGEDYHKDKTSQDGYSKYCKGCLKEYYHSVPKIVHRERSLKSRYGLSLQEYEEMLSKQNNCCAICEREGNDKYSMAVDHCHKTGKVRSLLCNKCNSALGYLEDDVELVNKAYKYLCHHVN